MIPDLSIAGELAYGGRATSIPAGRLAPIFEARVRADWWVNPNFTLGVSLGANLLDARDRTVTVGFGVHWSAFDGHEFY